MSVPLVEKQKNLTSRGLWRPLCILAGVSAAPLLAAQSTAAEQADPCALPVLAREGQPVPGAVPFSSLSPDGTVANLTLMSASIVLKRIGNKQPGIMEQGDTLLCTYTLTNTGAAAALDIRMTAQPNRPPPAGETLDDTAPRGDSRDTAPDDGVWSELAAGDAVTFTQSFPVSDGGTVSP